MEISIGVELSGPTFSFEFLQFFFSLVLVPFGVQFSRRKSRSSASLYNAAHNFAILCKILLKTVSNKRQKYHRIRSNLLRGFYSTFKRQTFNNIVESKNVIISANVRYIINICHVKFIQYDQRHI